MKKLVYIFCLLFLILSCSNSSDDGVSQEPEDNPDEEIITESPLKVNLVFPHNNSLCTQGEVISDAESSVLFEWQASNTAENYKFSSAGKTST